MSVKIKVSNLFFKSTSCLEFKVKHGGLSAGKGESKETDKAYEIFIGGETIDLVIPSVDAISRDNWHSWFK